MWTLNRCKRTVWLVAFLPRAFSPREKEGDRKGGFFSIGGARLEQRSFRFLLLVFVPLVGLVAARLGLPFPRESLNSGATHAQTENTLIWWRNCKTRRACISVLTFWTCRRDGEYGEYKCTICQVRVTPGIQ
jgi:hypothetical protein